MNLTLEGENRSLLHCNVSLQTVWERFGIQLKNVVSLRNELIFYEVQCIKHLLKRQTRCYRYNVLLPQTKLTHIPQSIGTESLNSDRVNFSGHWLATTHKRLWTGVLLRTLSIMDQKGDPKVSFVTRVGCELNTAGTLASFSKIITRLQNISCKNGKK